MLGGCLLAIIGYAMLLGSKSESVRYGGTFFVACGVFPGQIPLFDSRRHTYCQRFSDGYGMVVKQFGSPLRSRHWNRF